MFHLSPATTAARHGFSLMEVMVAVMVLAVAVSAVVGSISNLNNMRKDTEDVQQAHRAANFVAQAIQGTNWDDLNDLSKKGAYLTWARFPDVDNSGTIEDDTNCLTDGRQASMSPDPPDDSLAMSVNTRRRLPFSTTLVDLRIYVEYYRAITATDDTGAVLMNGANFCFAGLLQGVVRRTAGAGGETWTIDPSGGDPSRGQTELSGLSLTERVGTTKFRIPPIGISTADANGDGANDLIEPIRLPADATLASLSGVTIGANDPVAARIVVTWKDRNVPSAPGQRRRQFSLITGVKR